MSKEEDIDLTGTVCPHTQLSAIRAIHKAPQGTLLKMSVDNRQGLEAVITVMKNAGHRIVRTEHRGVIHTISVLKK